MSDRAKDVAWLKSRLEGIAAFDDEGANQHLARSGSYSRFDEPGSVKVAREILAEWPEIFPA